jgi:uncharacterized protein (TIGR02172 family)
LLTDSPIAQGRTAEIFAWTDGCILKLARSEFSLTYLEREAAITRAVHEAGLPVPRVVDVVEVDGRAGIVFERVEGPSMMKTMLSRPWTMPGLGSILAELHASMHQRTAQGLPSQREYLEKRIQGAESLPDDLKQAVIEVLHQLPDGSAVCHGDFHPGNIILSPQSQVILDSHDATLGNPLADVARTSLLLRVGALPPDTRFGTLVNVARRWFHRAYIRRYLELRPESWKEMTSWNLPIAAARMSENIEGEQEHLIAILRSMLRKQRKPRSGPPKR